MYYFLLSPFAEGRLVHIPGHRRSCLPVIVHLCLWFTLFNIVKPTEYLVFALSPPPSSDVRSLFSPVRWACALLAVGGALTEPCCCFLRLTPSRQPLWSCARAPNNLQRMRSSGGSDPEEAAADVFSTIQFPGWGHLRLRSCLTALRSTHPAYYDLVWRLISNRHTFPLGGYYDTIMHHLILFSLLSFPPFFVFFLTTLLCLSPFSFVWKHFSPWIKYAQHTDTYSMLFVSRGSLWHICPAPMATVPYHSPWVWIASESAISF